MKIVYAALGSENFNAFSLDSFIRKQTVKMCWRNVKGEYALKPVEYVEDWTLTERREMAAYIINELKNGGKAFGAFDCGKLIGYACISAGVLGSAGQYLLLSEFYVSLPYRNKGIGKRLFEEACASAKADGAKKLFISAHSAEDSIAAYKKFGCVLAKEKNEALAEKEPCDLQLEFVLN